MVPTFRFPRSAPGRIVALALALTVGAAVLWVPGTASAGPLTADLSTTDSGILDPRFTHVITHVDDTPATGEPTPALNGSVLWFEVTVDNEGKAPAYNMAVEQCFPDGIRFENFTSYPAGIVPTVDRSNPDCPGGKVTVSTVDDRFTESSFSYVAYALVTQAAAGAVLATTATLTAFEAPDAPEVARVPREWASTASVQVSGPSVEHTVTPASAKVGDTVTYSITVRLPGGPDFPAAYVRQRVPAGVEVTGMRFSSPDGVALTAPPLPATDGSTVDVLDWSGYIPAATTDRTFVIEVDAVITDDPGAAAGGEVVATASMHWTRIVTFPGLPTPLSLPAATAAAEATATVVVGAGLAATGAAGAGVSLLAVVLLAAGAAFVLVSRPRGRGAGRG